MTTNGGTAKFSENVAHLVLIFYLPVSQKETTSKKKGIDNIYALCYYFKTGLHEIIENC